MPKLCITEMKKVVSSNLPLNLVSLKGSGFVGVGKITKAAEMIRKVYVNGKRFLDQPLKCTNMDDNGDSAEKSEYVAMVKWIKAFTRDEAKWKRKAGLYTTTHVRASLDGQAETIAFIEKEFGVDLRKLIV